MLIQEVARACNITKKAIQYYVEQGFVHPAILPNGYRDFSEEDVSRFRQIVLYRKLGLGTAAIRRVLEDPAEMSTIVCQRALELEEEKARLDILKRLAAGEKIEDLAPEIDSVSAGSRIIQRLREMFPGFYGKFISLHFGRYLTERMETEEQMQAFQQIIDFLDHVPAITLPKDLQEYLDACEKDDAGSGGIETIQRQLLAQDQALQDIDAFVAHNHQMLDDYIRFKQTDIYQNLPAVRLMDALKQICTANGYYDVFIPAMRRLSPSYNRYCEQLLKADAHFAQNYPEYLV